LLKQKPFFDFYITGFTPDSLVDYIFASIDANEPTILLGLNADGLNLSRRNEAYRCLLRSGRFYVYPDGMSVIWALRFFGESGQQRIPTTDLIIYLMRRISIEKKDVTIGFLGGTHEIATLARRRLNTEFDSNCIVHSYEPGKIDMSDLEDPLSSRVRAILQELVSHPADILFVGLGSPKQEILCQVLQKHVPHKVLLPCGGLFSYYAGEHKRAPLWMQQTGLEWLFRLLLEPKRLWKRYLLGNAEFVVRVLDYKFRLMLGKAIARDSSHS